MLELKVYKHKEVRQHWYGYVEGNDYIVFFPADGGFPIVLPKETNEDSIEIEIIEEPRIKGQNERFNYIVLD